MKTDLRAEVCCHDEQRDRTGSSCLLYLRPFKVGTEALHNLRDNNGEAQPRGYEERHCGEVATAYVPDIWNLLPRFLLRPVSVGTMTFIYSHELLRYFGHPLQAKAQEWFQAIDRLETSGLHCLSISLRNLSPL